MGDRTRLAALVPSLVFIALVVGRAKYGQIRGTLEEITGRLFDFPAEDLATAGRVLALVTARANAEITGRG